MFAFHTILAALSLLIMALANVYGLALCVGSYRRLGLTPANVITFALLVYFLVRIGQVGFQNFS